jgi:hypothetical protein
VNPWVSSRYRPSETDRLPYNQEIIADVRAGARAHDGEFAQCIASAGRDRDGRFAEVHLGKIPHQRLVERVIQTGRNDLRFEQRRNLIEPFEQFAQISGQVRHANPFTARSGCRGSNGKSLG